MGLKEVLEKLNIPSNKGGIFSILLLGTEIGHIILSLPSGRMFKSKEKKFIMLFFFEMFYTIKYTFLGLCVDKKLCIRRCELLWLI